MKQLKKKEVNNFKKSIGEKMWKKAVDEKTTTINSNNNNSWNPWNSPKNAKGSRCTRYQRKN